MQQATLRPRGLTLLELLAVLAIVATLLGVGAPSLDKYVHEVRLLQLSRGLMAAVNLARSEAIRRNTNVSICPYTRSHSGEPACSDAYNEGWMVFVNSNRDREVDAGVDEVLQVAPAVPQGYQITNRAGTRAASGLISYRSDGSARHNLTLQICPPDHRVAPLSVVLNIVGRARLERNWGDCAVDV